MITGMYLWVLADKIHRVCRFYCPKSALPCTAISLGVAIAPMLVLEAKQRQKRLNNGHRSNY